MHIQTLLATKLTLRGRYAIGRTLPRWRTITRAQAAAWYKVARMGALPKRYRVLWATSTKAGQALILVTNTLWP